MKRGNRILALGLCLTMLFMALPIQNLQASTIAQQQVLYSLNGTAHLADETATDTSCLYYDTFTVSDGYTAALGNSNVTGIATYDEAQQNLSIGGFGGSNEHRLVPFAGITDAANLQNYMISADISVKASSAIAGVSAYTNGAVKGFTGYEFYIMEDELYLRCRATSELKVRKDSITNYFPDYKTGDTIRLSLAVVTNDNNVEAVGIISYNGVNKIVGGKQTFTGDARRTCGIPALRAFASTTTEILYTADNVLVEAVTGGIDGVISEIINKEALYSLNGTAHSADGSAPDNSRLYYDTFAVSDGYTAALGNSNVTGVATYDGAQQNLSIGGFDEGHKLVPFAGITNAADLQNYMISADISVKTSSAIAGVSAYTDGAVNGFTGYEFYIMEDNLYLRCRKTGEYPVMKDSITNYFPDYKTGDTIRLSLAVVTADDKVEAVGIVSYNGVNKIVGGKHTFTGDARWTCGIPALRAHGSDATQNLYTADNVLVEAVTGGIDGVISKMIPFELTKVILNIGADSSERNLNWQTNLELDFKVQYGLKSDMIGGAFPATYKEVAARKDCDTACGTVAHKATLVNLADDTEYVYRMVSGDIQSELYYFSTGNASDGFTFAFVGDPQVGHHADEGNGWETTVDAILRKDRGYNVDFMLISGDQVHKTEMANYDKFFYSKLSGLTTATIAGNHDNNATYNDYYNMPNVSDKYGVSKAEGDYYFVYGNTLFMCLNSNNLHKDTPNESEQAHGGPLTDEVKAYNKERVQEHIDFMSEVIAEHPEAIWKTVVLHQSIYSVSGHRNDLYVQEIKEHLEPALIDLDIDVVLMGHDHCYTRTYMMNGINTPDNANGAQSRVLNSNGILYITGDSASGNKYGKVSTQDYAAATSDPNMENRRATFSVMNITNDSYEIIVYRSEDLQELDRFTINKKVDVNNDGKSNSKDIAEMRNILLGSSKITAYDFNEDGIINIVDLVALKKFSRK